MLGLLSFHLKDLPLSHMHSRYELQNLFLDGEAVVYEFWGVAIDELVHRSSSELFINTIVLFVNVVVYG